jgi:hypothetical protein
MEDHLGRASFRPSRRVERREDSREVDGQETIGGDACLGDPHLLRDGRSPV